MRHYICYQIVHSWLIETSCNGKKQLSDNTGNINSVMNSETVINVEAGYERKDLMERPF